MNYNKCICHYLLMLISISFLVSCTSPSKGKNEIDEIQEMENRIIKARQEDNFETQQLLGDKMYSFIRDQHDCETELWLALHYFYLCCLNGGSEEDVKMKLELYTEKYLGLGILYETVKDMDAIWFSNIQRSAELIIRAYEDSPSLTMKELENDDIYPKAFQAFARIVLRKR
ncbi:MAG: hypothetical protein J1E37_08510 [Prevotella sp.]|nr:hypothetical protein [Prevotella sp.]